MLRSHDTIVVEDGIKLGLNALGFAGTMAVKSEIEFEKLKEVTPIGLLEKVSVIKE